MNPPVFVLDTNVVLDWLVFEDGGAPELMQAINTERVLIATNQEIIDELQRVLGYPNFELSAEAQTAALAKYETRATHNATRKSLAERIPRCRDQDDQKFLDLAAYAGAHALVSKDNAVLGLKRQMKSRFGCDVLRPLETAQWLTTWETHE